MFAMSRFGEKDIIAEISAALRGGKLRADQFCSIREIC
jgi:hypothetical protein